MNLLDSMIHEQEKESLKSYHLHRPNPSFIPLQLTGGIGDVIMAIDSIKRLKEEFQVIVYTPHGEALKYFYKEPLSVFNEVPEFTWVLQFDTVAKFILKEGFHGFLVKEHEELFLKQREAFRKDPILQNLVESYSDRFFLISRYAEAHGINRRQFPLISLGYDKEAVSQGFQVFPRKEKRRYFTIHDGFDIQSAHLIRDRSTKQWSLKNWNELVGLLNEKYPSYAIIQLGSSTSRRIDAADVSFLQKTTLTEAFDLLSHSSHHIDGDSGLVHAAARMQVPSTVIWGSTPMPFYSYPENFNLKSSVCNQACYGVKEDWMARCPIGYNRPVCMDETTPEQVLETINIA